MYIFPGLYCMPFLVLYCIFSLFRFQQIKQQYDLKVHEAELVQARLKQSTHHHQLQEVEALQKTVGTSSVVFICNSCLCYNAFETHCNPCFSNFSLNYWKWIVPLLSNKPIFVLLRVGGSENEDPMIHLCYLPVSLDLCLRKSRPGKSDDDRNSVIVSENSSYLKSIFEKLRFRDGAVRTAGQT